MPPTTVHRAALLAAGVAVVPVLAVVAPATVRTPATAAVPPGTALVAAAGQTTAGPSTAGRPGTVTGPAPVAGHGWPLGGSPAVLRAFEAPASAYAAGHRGVDLGGVPGQPVLAAADGAVAFAGQVAGRGVVSVDHPGGLRTTYEPVVATVRAGDAVARGMPLGSLAATPGHCSPAPCLHWGLRRGAVYLDPLALDGPVSVRLLPLGLPPRWPPAAPERVVSRWLGAWPGAPGPAWPVGPASPGGAPVDGASADRGPAMARDRP